MRQLGEKKKIMNYVVLCYPSGFQAGGKGGGGMMCVIFFFSKENWKLPVKERTVPFRAAETKDWYKAVLY